MKKRIIISLKADEDLDGEACLPGPGQPPGSGFGSFHATRRAFEQISEMLRGPGLAGSGLSKASGFYQITDEGVLVLRVLHAARDISGLLEEE